MRKWGGYKKCPYLRGVRIKRVEFRDNVKAFFPQGQSKQFLILNELSVLKGLCDSCLFH